MLKDDHWHQPVQVVLSSLPRSREAREYVYGYSCEKNKVQDSQQCWFWRKESWRGTGAGYSGSIYSGGSGYIRTTPYNFFAGTLAAHLEGNFRLQIAYACIYPSTSHQQKLNHPRDCVLSTRSTCNKVLNIDDIVSHRALILIGARTQRRRAALHIIHHPPNYLAHVHVPSSLPPKSESASSRVSLGAV